MISPDSSLQFKQTDVDLESTSHSGEAEAQVPALRLHQQERLARLFRNVADNRDDLYLHNLMARYRGAASS